MEEQKADARKMEEREARGEETSVSDWTTDSEERGEGEGGPCLDAETQDDDGDLRDLPGMEEDEKDNGDEDGEGEGDGEDEGDKGYGDSEESEEDEGDGEGDGEETEEIEQTAEDGEEHEENEAQEEAIPKQLEAAAELVLPEYPVLQLDREAVLTAFRLGRDRGTYNHVNIWDDY